MTQKQEITLGELEGNPSLYYNPVVYEQVVRENYRNMVEYGVRRFTNISFSDAEDLVQRVFMELLEAIGEGIRRKSVPASRWLFQRLHQRCLNMIRRSQRAESANTLMDTQTEDIIELIPDPSSAPDEMVERQEIIEFIRDCIDNRLSNRTQEVIQLLFVEGLSQVEAARQLGVTEPRVAQLKRKGIGLLKKWLQEAGFLT